MKDDTPAEFSFKWRRIIAIVWIVWNSILTTIIVVSDKMDARNLMWMGIALIISNIFMALFYMAGASAVDIGKIAQGLSQIRTPRRTIDEDDYRNVG